MLGEMLGRLTRAQEIKAWAQPLQSSIAVSHECRSQEKLILLFCIFLDGPVPGR